MNEEKKSYEELTRLWEEFGDTPIDNEDRILEKFQEWEAGTRRWDIWSWFAEQIPGGRGMFPQGDNESKQEPVFITVLRRDGYFWTILCTTGGENLGIWLRDHFSSQEKADWIVEHGDAESIGEYGKIGKWREISESGECVDLSGLAVGAPDFRYEECSDSNASLFYCNEAEQDWECICPEVVPTVDLALAWGKSHSHIIWDGERWAINRSCADADEADFFDLPVIRAGMDVMNLSSRARQRQEIKRKESEQVEIVRKEINERKRMSTKEQESVVRIVAQMSEEGSYRTEASLAYLELDAKYLGMIQQLRDMYAALMGQCVLIESITMEGPLVSQLVGELSQIPKEWVESLYDGDGDESFLITTPPSEEELKEKACLKAMRSSVHVSGAHVCVTAYGGYSGTPYEMNITYALGEWYKGKETKDAT